MTDFAAMLTGNFRESDVIGRLGGDEFAALLVNTDQTRVASALAHLQRTVDEHNRTQQRGYDLRYSVGAVNYDPLRHGTIADLMNSADALMYEHKKQRRAAH